MIILYILLGLLAFWILWSVIKFAAGTAGMKKDPEGTGVKYLRRQLSSLNSSYSASIPEDALREFSQLAYRMAEINASVRNEAVVNEFVGNLDHYVTQIDGIMRGLPEIHGLVGGDDVVVEKLQEHGVELPKR